MPAVSLKTNLRLATKDYEIFYKTGIYQGVQKKGSGHRLFILDDSDGEEFRVHYSMNLNHDIGLEIGDRISIALYSQSETLFFAFNHRNAKSRYYEYAVVDKYWGRKSNWNIIKNLILYLSIKRRAKVFPKSKSFLKMYNAILENAIVKLQKSQLSV